MSNSTSPPQWSNVSDYELTNQLTFTSLFAFMVGVTFPEFLRGLNYAKRSHFKPVQLTNLLQLLFLLAKNCLHWAHFNFYMPSCLTRVWVVGPLSASNFCFVYLTQYFKVRSVLHDHIALGGTRATMLHRWLVNVIFLAVCPGLFFWAINPASNYNYTILVYLYVMDTLLDCTYAYLFLKQIRSKLLTSKDTKWSAYFKYNDFYLVIVNISSIFRVLVYLFVTNIWLKNVIVNFFELIRAVTLSRTITVLLSNSTSTSPSLKYVGSDPIRDNMSDLMINTPSSPPAFEVATSAVNKGSSSSSNV
ncbi:hypothetical protein HK102_011909 [Quaeritorhiza haematococci]|nr:hypothetical protein HK102_011909 [Quaeritorhiza haematococci]